MMIIESMFAVLLASAPASAATCQKVQQAEKLIDQGKFQEALPVAKAGVKECEAAHAKGARPYVTLGKVYSELKQYDLAAQNYEKAIKQEPKLGLAYFSLGGIYTMQSKYPEAIRVLEQALKLKLTKEEMAKTNFNMGYAYFSIAADKEDTADRRSEEWFKKSKALDPKIAQNWYYLGVLQELSYKNKDAAKHLYKKACELAFEPACESFTNASLPAAQAPVAAPANKEYPFSKAEEAALKRIDDGYRKKGMSKEDTASTMKQIRASLKTVEPQYRKQSLDSMESALK